jgi:hypothetical protein
MANAQLLRYAAERDEAKSAMVALGTEVNRLQRLEAVATTGPALLALIQRGRAELHQLEADLAAIAPPAAG